MALDPPRLATLRLVVEYDGSFFSGFQRQTNIVKAQQKQIASSKQILTVQGELEQAIAIYLTQLTGKMKQRRFADDQVSEISVWPNVVGSGRTDAGVHACNQVVSFALPEIFWPFVAGDFLLERFRRALDGITSRYISIKTIEMLNDNGLFDPRKNVVCKQYRYNLLLRRGQVALEHNRVWYISNNLDIKEMIVASKEFVGRYNFTSFSAIDTPVKNKVRTVFLSELVRISPENLVYIIQGEGFLKQMVRNIVGTVVEIGRGKLPVEAMENILASKNRQNAGATAPANGLFLSSVEY